MTTQLPDTFTISTTITAAGCNAQMQMPPSALVEMLINAATAHANALDIGYSRLVRSGMAWVLSRLAYQVERMPELDDKISITTWVESFNRHFSQRNFIICANDTNIGYARTVWAAIDINARRPADLSVIVDSVPCRGDIDCPIAPPAKVRPITQPDATGHYTVEVSDTDSNRHLTTARYVQLAINTGTLDYYDTHFISRLDCTFNHECRYKEMLTILSSNTTADITDVCFFSPAVQTPAAGIRLTATKKVAHSNINT